MRFLGSVPAFRRSSSVLLLCFLLAVATHAPLEASTPPGASGAGSHGPGGRGSSEGSESDPRWWDRALGRIQDSEYELTWQDQPSLSHLPPAWQAPNRAQGFRTYFTEKGIHVVPRKKAGSEWELSLTLRSFGRGEMLRLVASAVPSADGNRADLDRRVLREWYVNAPEGLEQGFSIPEPPRAGENAPESGDTSRAIRERIT